MADGYLNKALGRFGLQVESTDRIDLLEAVATDHRALQRDLEFMGWTVLNHVSGQTQEVRTERRLEMARKARYVWMNDPQAGAAVDLLCSFVLGRGIPEPTAKDEDVQQILEDAWNDDDNQAVLTGFAAQTAFLTDLQLQGTVVFKWFEDGDDGGLKLALLDYDTITGARTDPEAGHRILYVVTKESNPQEWDYKTDMFKPVEGIAKTVYYEHWKWPSVLDEEGESYKKPPANKVGKGKVYLVSINKTGQQVFGTPPMMRLIRWFTAYNDYMAARVTIAKAAAAFLMRRKVKGTENQLVKMATKALSRRSDLAMIYPEEQGMLAPPAPGSIINENEGVEHEQLRLDSGAGNAMSDAQMLRSQISAGTHFPQHYLGDAGSANLATATSMELPVLKHIEFVQETVEQVFRDFFDRVIERAVDAGALTTELEGEQLVAHLVREGYRWFDGDDGRYLAKPVLVYRQTDDGFEATVEPDPRLTLREGAARLVEAHEDQTSDEISTERDLSYNFSLPSPLRRMMTELVAACAQVAQVFDPNNTNPKLSRVLLTIIFGEGFEIADPGSTVDEVMPEDYQDPAIAAAQAAQMGGAPGPPNMFGPEGQFGGMPSSNGAPQGEANPYGAPMRATPPEQVPGSQEGRLVEVKDRMGDVIWRGQVPEATTGTPEQAAMAARTRLAQEDAVFAQEVEAVAAEALAAAEREANASSNGHPEP